MGSTTWLFRTVSGAVIALAGIGAAAPVAAETVEDSAPFAVLMQRWRALDAAAPVDYGPGRGRPKPSAHAAPRLAAPQLAAATPAVPVGGPDAGSVGFYAPAANWPIMPIHFALLPDGRVMSYGTDQTGERGAQLYYDVWTPSLGTDDGAHMLLPNATSTDIFCSGQALDWTTGDLFVIGGDQRPLNAGRNINTTALFDPPTNTIRASAPMRAPRWYSTLVAMPSGQFVVLGGRRNPADEVQTFIPEAFDATNGWRTLPEAASTDVFYNKYNWFYPRAFVAPNGMLFVMAHSGGMYWLDPTGEGTLVPAGGVPPGIYQLPSLMFAPGKILALRGSGNSTNAAVVIDINGPTPVATPTRPTAQIRKWANATVLADGQVLVTGGSSVGNELAGLQYQNETWDPATGQWTPGAVATKPRLYHSNALLLPDGSVMTGGGGSPGPVINLNVEQFYPPYLYLKDGSGQPAPRPTLQVLEPVVRVGQATRAYVGANDQIARLTLVKLGASTHSVDIDQRFFDLPFTRPHRSLHFTLPSNPNVLIPGYYMVFAINTAGTPSVANIIKVLPQS